MIQVLYKIYFGTHKVNEWIRLINTLYNSTRLLLFQFKTTWTFFIDHSLLKGIMLELSKIYNRSKNCFFKNRNFLRLAKRIVLVNGNDKKDNYYKIMMLRMIIIFLLLTNSLVRLKRLVRKFQGPCRSQWRKSQEGALINKTTRKCFFLYKIFFRWHNNY